MFLGAIQIAFDLQGRAMRRNPRRELLLRFNSEIHCVTSLYRQCLSLRDESPRISELVVELLETEWDQDSTWNGQGPTRYHLKWHYVVPDDHFTLDELARKRRLLDLTHEIVSSIGRRTGWDIQRLNDAYDECLRRGLKNQFFWPKNHRIMSPNRKHYGHVFYDFGMSEITLDLVVELRDGTEVERKRITTIPAVDWHLFAALNKLRWKSNRVVVLQGVYPSDRWEVRLDATA